MSALFLIIALGVSADWLAPSLRPAIAATVGRNVTALLDARSPGVRLSGTLLTKIKSALTSVPHGKPSLASPAGGPRRRLIPPRTGSDPVPTDPADDGIAHLLGPLERLESPTEVGGLATPLPELAETQPIFATGEGGGSGGGPAIFVDFPPVVPTNTPTSEVPALPVPEPDIWLTMLVGFGLTGAALRRRGRGAKAVEAS